MAYKIKKDLAFRRIAGEIFIVDAARSEMRELNATAAAIWEGLAAGKEGATIAAAIAEEFDTDPATARADVAAFTGELLAARLIEKL